MKTRFFWILSALLLWAIVAKGDIVTATVTVTNTPANGATFVVNSNTRTWTNTASTPVASWITIASGVGPTTTNLYLHIAANPYSSPFLTVGRSSTNVVTLISSTGVLTVTTNEWMTVSYVTNVSTSVYALAVPPWNVVGATNRTNNGHWLVDYLNDWVVTNSFRTNANVASNYMTKGASPQQYVASPVQFNGQVRAAAGIFGTNGILVSTTNVNPVLSNGVNYGNAFRSEGSGGNSFQVGSNAQSLGATSISMGNNATATNASDAAIGNNTIASGGSATAVGNGAAATASGATALGNNSAASAATTIAIGAAAASSGVSAIGIGTLVQSSSANSLAIGADSVASAQQAIAIGNDAEGSANSSVAIGTDATASHSNSVAIGASAATTETNQLRLGTSAEKISIPGILLISGTQSNTTFRGTNIAGGSWSFPRADLSSIANGNNISIPIGTNQFVRLSGTVTASPSLCGFIGAATSGGNDGQWVALFNDLGYSLTLAQNTVDPVSANRLESADGNDVTVAANGWATLRYSSSDSRWHIENYYPQVLSASATNALSVVGTNTVPISGSVTGLFFWPGANMTIDATNSSGRVDILLTSGAGGGSGVATQLFVGKTYYLDNAVAAASDANVGTNLAAPLLTVSNAFNRLSSGDTLYIRPGTYTVAAFGETHFTAWSDRTNAPLRLPALTNVTIEGTGPGSLIQWSGVGNLISLWQCDGITLRNIRFKGPGKNLNQSANTWTNIMGAIVMWNAGPSQVTGGDGTNYNIRLEGCVIEDFPDHGIIGIPGSENYGVTVVNNLFRRGGEAYHPTMDRDGAAVVPGASRVVVSGNRFEDVQHAIEFEQSFTGGGSAGTMSDIAIVGNQIKNAWYRGVTIWPGVTSQAKNVVISGNTVECIPTNHPAILTGSVGIEIAGGSEFSISGNTLRGGWNYGIGVSATMNASNGIISGNSIAVDGLGAGNLAIGISVQHTATGYADSWLIDGNTIAGAEDFAAIYVSGKNTVVRNNLITYTLTAGHGVMVVTNVPANSTTNNVVAGNAFFGIGGTNIVVGVGVTNTILANNTTTTPKARWIADSGTGTRYSWVWSEPWAAGSNITFSTNATTGAITIAASVSGSGIETNGNQFGASIPITIKSGAVVTNFVTYGGTNVLAVTNLSDVGIGGNLITFGQMYCGDTVTFGSDLSVAGPVSITSLTASTVLASDGSKNVVSVANAAGMLTNNGAGVLGYMTIPTGGSGGTNFPAILRGNPAVATALNGPGTRQIVTWETNASFEMAFSGAPLNGQEFEIGVANTNTATIYMTNTAGIFDPTVASNVTTFAIAGTSARWFTFKSSTNWNLGVARWELHHTLGKEFEMAVAGSNAVPFLAFSTNASASVITISNTYVPMPTNLVLANLVGTVANNVTNESSTALQINAGTLTLSPGTVSNLVNNTTIDFQPGNVITNVIAQKWNIWTNYVQTVSNFVFTFNTNRYELKNQTNVVFTNLVEEATAVGADMAVHIHNTTGVTMGLVWPAYGAQHGYFFQTNINNPILTSTTLTTGKHGVAAFTAFGTNIFATWTEWP